MASSRTGTTRYKRSSDRVLKAAKANGLTHCPCDANCRAHAGRRCSVPLDYENRTRPNGASVDHIQPHARGGTDDMHNLRILCLYCNQALGDGRQRKRLAAVKSYTPTTTGSRRPGRPPTS